MPGLRHRPQPVLLAPGRPRARLHPSRDRPGQDRGRDHRRPRRPVRHLASSPSRRSRASTSPHGWSRASRSSSPRSRSPSACAAGAEPAASWRRRPRPTATSRSTPRSASAWTRTWRATTSRSWGKEPRQRRDEHPSAARRSPAPGLFAFPLPAASNRGEGASCAAHAHRNSRSRDPHPVSGCRLHLIRAPRVVAALLPTQCGAQPAPTATAAIVGESIRTFPRAACRQGNRCRPRRVVSVKERFGRSHSWPSERVVASCFARVDGQRLCAPRRS